jgi:hypothetical protein
MHVCVVVGLLAGAYTNLVKLQMQQQETEAEVQEVLEVGQPVTRGSIERVLSRCGWACGQVAAVSCSRTKGFLNAALAALLPPAFTLSFVCMPTCALHTGLHRQQLEAVVSS